MSHGLSAVQELCTRAILLDKGRIIQDAPVSTVVSNYLALQSELELLSGTMDVSHPSLRRSSLPDSRFHWTKVTILNSAGKLTGLLKFGEPFEIILKGSSDADLSYIRVGFSVSSAVGGVIFNSFQVDNGISERIPQGNRTFRVHINPNLLSPGLYQIGLGANGEGIVDWLPYTLQFKIIADDKENVWRSYHGGVISYPCKWHME